MSDTLNNLKNEATDTGQDIVFRDVTFRIAPGEDWVMDFLHYTDRDKVTLAIEAALGPAQYEQLRALNPRPKLPEYMALLNQIGSTLGTGLGEA